MLKKIYIDNFRCLVNFELELGQQQLILGLNGSGKSTLLDALSAVKSLVSGDASPDKLFPDTSRTRWQTAPLQTVELRVDLGADYLFRLELASAGMPARTRIERELLWCDGHPIFEFVDGEVRLYNDSFEAKIKYPFDSFASALATIQPRSDNTRLIRFKNWINHLHCLRVNPVQMSERTEHEEAQPATDLANFASWYRYMTQEKADSASKLQEELREIIPGLESLNLRSEGANLRTLALRFARNGAEGGGKFTLGFSELSEGQRVLICLYALLNFVVEGESCLFLDEPENYIALPEIQPWLMELGDRISESGGQVILISHHPEILDYMAPEMGLVLERAGSGPVRVRHYESEASLSPSEQIARGWHSGA